MSVMLQQLWLSQGQELTPVSQGGSRNRKHLSWLLSQAFGQDTNWYP